MESFLTIPIYSMNKKTLHFIFIVFAVLAFCALVFHIKEIFYPATITPAWRHAIFVLINCICIYGLLKRPKWFVWFVGLLTLQQWYSHGSYAVELWQTAHKIHWPSVGVLVLMPVSFILLIFDRREKAKTKN